MSPQFQPKPLGVLAPVPGIGGWEGSGLAEHVGGLPDELRETVANYLATCPVFLAWMEHTRDQISDRFGVDGGSAIVSDGAFYWRLDAAAYVREYGIAVPREAIENMRQRNWTPPEFARDDYLSLYSILLNSLQAELGSD